MIYFAHRGANTRAPQNTLPAFTIARNAGATCYELDVHLTSDGEIVVHHDYTLTETAGQDLSIARTSWAELSRHPLRRLTDKEDVFIPRLGDVLPIIAPDLQLLNIEIKNENNLYDNPEEKVWDYLEKNFPDLLPKILFSSFDFATLDRLRTLAPQARIGLLTRFFDVNKALDLHAESVHLNHTRFTPQLAQTCHENILKVYLYTVNTVELARQLRQDGADGIFTDEIQLFL